MKKKRTQRLSIRGLGKCLIVLFCVWQMFAVAVWSVPFNDKRTVPLWIRTHLKPVVDPYMYATNQWQRWHMFVPERPAYIARYVLEIAGPGIHHPAQMLTPEQLALFVGDDTADRQTFIAAMCRHLRAPAGAPLWLSERDYVDPDVALLEQPDAAMNTSLEWFQYYRFALQCPPASS